jgi:hypothetical protein
MSEVLPQYFEIPLNDNSNAGFILDYYWLFDEPEWYNRFFGLVIVRTWPFKRFAAYNYPGWTPVEPLYWWLCRSYATPHEAAEAAIKVKRNAG